MRYSMTKDSCEYLRVIAKEKFDVIRQDWIEYGLWALPHRTRHLLQKQDGVRTSQHIVDPTHRTALRSFTAGFLEGNTSASRPWFKHVHQDPDINRFPANKVYLEKLTRKVLNIFSQSNFYDSSAQFYPDYGVFNTGAHIIDQRETGLHYHLLDPGSYFPINNVYGEPVILVREFSLTVKALVDRYSKNGKSSISKDVWKMYDDGNYTTKVNCCQILKENDDYDANKPQTKLNRPWISITYELGSGSGRYYIPGQEHGNSAYDPEGKQEFLEVSATSWKPFVVGKSQSSGNFEYGETGPTEIAYGLIRSLNKKAISKDLALEQLVKPTMMGPASLKNAYRTNQANTYIPLDATAMAQGGLKRAFEINPAIASLIQDVEDLRNLVEKIYYADFLLYLSRNPKTRTATETTAIKHEQQLVIGPNLQSLNLSYNIPHVEIATKFVLDTDPEMWEVPEALQGVTLRTDFISVFAQAQRAADLPAVDQYMQAMMNLAQIDPKIFDKVNVDKFADLYEDRLYLPAGLNRDQKQVDAMRQAQEQAAQRQIALQETIPAVAGAAKDMGLSLNNNNS